MSSWPFQSWGTQPRCHAMSVCVKSRCQGQGQVITSHTGLGIKHLVYMPIGHVVLKIYVPWKSFHVPSQYLYKPCKAYVYCWKNKYMPTLKNHMACRACNHKSLCALGQDLHAPGMRACLNVEPCHSICGIKSWKWDGLKRYYLWPLQVVEVSPRCVSPVSVWRSVTTTSVRWLK